MALVGKNSEKNNQNLMQLIRRAHGLVENPDLEKHRQSQDHIGELLGNSKEIQYRPVDIDGMDAEWVSVNRAHMKKYVILHCHGGGYSTGSSIYARSWRRVLPWMCCALITDWHRSIRIRQLRRMP